MKKRSGFTLVEIMVVVVIIGLLAGIVGPQIWGRLEEARRTTARTQIRAFESALDMYRLHNGIYPTTQQSLEALVRRPTLAPIPRRYAAEGYVREIPADPWGNPYIYRSPGERHPYDIISTGRTGEEGGDGLDADVTNHDPS
jgi:general secretion pathway protein G